MTELQFMTAWVSAFLLTQVIELVVHAHAPGLVLPLRGRLAVGFGASAITHPMVWFVIPPVVSALMNADRDTEWWTAIAVAETFAFTAEALWLWMFGVRAKHALFTSLVANGASFGMGLFCYRALEF
ncbi:MAG: hypothetical protein AB8I08_31980 [Sandaracinaceae bacterium]